MARRSCREHGPGRYYGPRSEATCLNDWKPNYARRPTSTHWQEIVPGTYERRCVCAIIQARCGRDGPERPGLGPQDGGGISDFG